MTDLNASVFKYTNNSHLNYLEFAYERLIEAYWQLLRNNDNITNKNENSIRDDLVKIAKTKTNINFPFRWITEFPNIRNNTRIDIDLATPQSLLDESKAIKIECKIVGEDKYIDTKTSFYKTKPTNGIMSFITGKYAAEMPVAGMIGFIKIGDINKKIIKMKKRLDNHTDITTLQNLEKINISDFKYSFLSKHQRSGELNDIELYHLFFDVSINALLYARLEAL